MLPAALATRRDPDDHPADERLADGRLAHHYNVSNLRRSARDAVWYGGQVAVLGLAYNDHPRVIYVILGLFALCVSVATAVEAVRWRREVRRDAATDARGADAARVGAGRAGDPALQPR